MIRRREIIGCPCCGANKDRTTRSYGMYRAYRVGNTIILRCRTCKKEIRYKILAGGLHPIDFEV